MIPLFQVLSDLGVADGQELKASDAPAVAKRVREKLERMSAVHEFGPLKGQPVNKDIGFHSPRVALETTSDVDVVILRVSAETR